MDRSRSVAYHVRPYRRADRRAVRRICVETAWLGKAAPDRIGDEWIWGEYWTRYFTDREPAHTWVAARDADHRVVGYLTGTADVRRVDRFTPFLLPGIAARLLTRRAPRRRGPRRALFCMARSVLRGEFELPPHVNRACPATFHVNLLPEARGCGVGDRLFTVFANEMRRLRVPGIHVRTLSVNLPISRFLARRDFRRVATRTITAFAHIDAQPIDLYTWVLPDRPGLPTGRRI